MIRRLLVILILFAVYTTGVNAQTWQWARRAGATGGGGGTEYDGVYDMKVDKNGNTYSLVVFDGGIRNISTSNNIPVDDSFPTVIGSQDVGIISYDKCGKLRWYKIIGTLSQDYARNIGLDSLGNVYASFTAAYSNLKIGNDTLLPNAKGKSIQLVKFDSTGKFKWIRMPNPDTVNYIKNVTQYSPLSSYTEQNGDTYMFCLLGKGLISGSTNLVANTYGFYVLKYNNLGVPISLTKMDMSDSVPFATTQFLRTKTGKFLISGQMDYSLVSTPVYLGTTQISKPVLICCFSSTGQFVWKVENTGATNANSSALRIVWDESRSKIYVGGAVYIGDGILGFVTTNLPGYTGSLLSTIGCLDSSGNLLWMKNAYQKSFFSTFYIGALTPNGKVYGGGGTTGIVDWGNGFSYNALHQGYIAAFDVNTTNIVELDSIKGNSGSTYLDVSCADSSNNVYYSGFFTSDVNIGNQSFGNIGGDRDFFIAKYGVNNCGTTPLHFLNYSIQFKPNNMSLIENYWTTSNEINVSRFNVQRSTNGKDFTTISTVSAMNKNLNEYRFGDDKKNIEAGIKTLYYRIESIDFGGEISYSQVRNIDLEIKDNEIRVYPNPAHDFVNIVGNNIKEIQIIDWLGRVFYREIATGTNLRNDAAIINIKNFNKGLYVVQVTTAKGEVKTEKLIVE